MFTVRRCDNCGKINPKRYEGIDRLCGEPKCVTPKGFYRDGDNPLGTNGKVGWYRFRFLPFRIRFRWLGWWKLSHKK